MKTVLMQGSSQAQESMLLPEEVQWLKSIMAARIYRISLNIGTHNPLIFHLGIWF